MKILTEDSVTLFVELKPVHIGKDHPKFQLIYDLAMQDKIEEAIELIDVKAAIQEAIEGTCLAIRDDSVYYGDICIEGLLGDRLMMFLEKGIDITPLTNFIVQLYKNPSYRAVTELFGFLEGSGLPITPDGCFVAYKRVNHDCKDCYTSTKIGRAHV